MHIIDLGFIYDKLKEKYDIELTSGLQLDSGFGWDIPVLTGIGSLGRSWSYTQTVCLFWM